MKTAVLLLAFNRPDTTYHVFQAIRRAKPERLYLAIDGPRQNHPDDRLYINRIKEIVENVDWNCQIKTLYRSSNLGCKQAVASAINWFFTNENEGIILEDDCVPTPDFFKFSELMLKRYRNNHEVMMISGTNYLAPHFNPETSYLFSRYFAIWGWATWKRAWSQYDPKMSDWSQTKSTDLVERAYPQKYMQQYLSRMFDSVYSGSVDTWDVQWFYTCLKAKGLTVVPSVNLISNIGLIGTHTSGDFTNNNLPTQLFDWQQLSHPQTVSVNPTYDSTLCRLLFKPNYFRIIGMKLAKLYELSNFDKGISFLLRAIHRLRLIRDRGVISNVNRDSYPKSCLIVYITLPFTNKLPKLYRSHQNYYQVRELARVVGTMGYTVDVIDYNFRNLRLITKYDLVIDIHPVDQPVYRNNLKSSAVKVAYLTGSNPTFSNEAEYKRLSRIYDEKGIKLQPRRQVPVISRKIEQYDAVLIMGNEQTKKTFADEFSLPSTFLLPNTALPNSLSLSHKSASSFLYLGGVGQVHKGLDLVLEAFADIPQAKLYVCSPFAAEQDFTRLYSPELYHTKNIVAVGQIDTASKLFHDIASECTFSLLPSCSEGSAGSVITSMSYGLIPLITKECGVNIKSGQIIANPTVTEIKKLVKHCLAMSKNTLNDLAVTTKTDANISYSHYNYTYQLKTALTKILDK